MLESREHCTVSGVLRVASFDDKAIVLETDFGALTLQGHELQIKQLDLDAGTFAVQGVVQSLHYAAAGAASGAGRRAHRGVMGRLFR